MKRQVSAFQPVSEVSRQLDNTAYDNVVTVKNNLIPISAVAAAIISGDLTAAIAATASVATIINMTAVGGAPGTQPSWDAVNGVLTVPVGAIGPTGPQGIQGVTGTAGKTAYQTAVDNGFVGTEAQWLASLVGATGATGSTGATGAVGNGITSVVRTTGNGAPGTTDTYTITYTNATTSTFLVYNGADGAGAGDMTKVVYDTTNNGIVDNAEKVNGLTVLTAVPSGALFTDTIYTHPTTDGSLHVPATSTTNSGKVLTAGATAGSMTWETPATVVTDHGLLTGLGNDHHPQYLTNSRGDARYSVLAHGHSGVYEPVDATIVRNASTSTLTNKTIEGITNSVGSVYTQVKVKNMTGSSLLKGTLVKVGSYTVGEETIRVVATTATTDIAIGMIHTTIPTGEIGLVVSHGVLQGINTSAYPVGTPLYTSSAGSLIDVKPIIGGYQAVAMVMRQAIDGALLLSFNEPDYSNTKADASHVHTGVYEPADPNILKTAAIGTTVQAYNANTTTQGNTFNGVSQLVQTTALGKLPAIDGSLLTGLPAVITSHTGLTDIGTNTHAQIDTHIGSTANPHSVTAVQVGALALAGGTMTGAITRVAETRVAMGANEIALASGNLFTKTISGATTLTVSGWLPSGNANSFILELTNGGSAVVTWFAGVKWASGTVPTLTAAGVDILGFYSHDGGTTVRGMVLSKDNK